MDDSFIFTPLLPKSMVQDIPIEFAPLLMTGYNIPISYFNGPAQLIVPEENIDTFLDKNPELIDDPIDNQSIVKGQEIAENLIQIIS